MRTLCLTIILALALSLAPRAVGAADFDHALFDQVLAEHVNGKGLIDYNGVARDPRFAGYIETLKTADLAGMSRDERLAFWINAYNAITIDKVIRWKPKKSVRETFIPGLWTSTKFYEKRESVVAGRSVSPDDIENEILRKEFEDPRIHFAIICASSGCPPQPRFAYTGENVQAKLEEETRSYLQSERGTRIKRDKNVLSISSIFDWFGGDFVRKSGSVLDFIRPYVTDEVRAFLAQDPKIDHLDYNWALNAQAPLK